MLRQALINLTAAASGTSAESLSTLSDKALVEAAQLVSVSVSKSQGMLMTSAFLDPKRLRPMALIRWGEYAAPLSPQAMTVFYQTAAAAAHQLEAADQILVALKADGATDKELQNMWNIMYAKFSAPRLEAGGN